MAKKIFRDKQLSKVAKYLMDGENIKEIANGVRLTYHGVRNWREKGVPEKHWEYLREHHGFLIEDLYAHNRACEA